MRNDTSVPFAASPSPAGASAPVDQQVLSVVAPLKDAGNGTHTLLLSLQPAGLGEVQARVVLDNGMIDVKLWASSHAGHQALGSALGDLRQQLGGEAGANVDLAGWGEQPGRQFQPPAAPPGHTASRPEPSGVADTGPSFVPGVATSKGNRLVDLLM